MSNSHNSNIQSVEENKSNSESPRTLCNKSQEGKPEIILNEIDGLQKSIQKISMKIEEDKINLRILQERFVKKQSEYNQLSGKPIIKSKEQKLNELKEKLEKLKHHHIFDPNYGKKKQTLVPGEETKQIKKNTDKCKIELDNLINAINKTVLFNSELTNQIEEIRKERARIFEKLAKSDEQNKQMEQELELIKKKNSLIYNKIQFQELAKIKEKGKVIESEFTDKRDNLENEYHKVIEANIRREKEHKNDLRKMRLKNAIFADMARAKGENGNDMKMEDEDEIHDRIPILDLLINKWKYITKYKKNMLDKYIKYAKEVRTSFSKLLDYLGIEKLETLPDIYTKNEEQMSSIEAYLSSLTTEVDNLVENKNLKEKQILLLSNTKTEDKKEQKNLIEERKSKIQSLIKYNDELLENINRKKRIFKELEKPTFDFLRKMQTTYLTDFVVNKNNVDNNTRLTENNIINYLGTIYCYCQLIRDFDESVKNSNQYNKPVDLTNEVNKNLDLLKKDIKLKLSKINYENCVNGDIHNSINNVIKHGNDFDETIRRLANVIVEQVNHNGDYSLNNISSMNTNNVSS